ncbi:MAG TPA: glycosyltransferase family 9 protein [Anaerolineales bacterium]
MQTEMLSTVGLAFHPGPIDRDPPRRVAIFRPLGLEGLLTATPALRAIRTALPAAEVTYIGDRESGEVVGRFTPYIDDFMLCPAFPGLHTGPGDAEAVLTFLQQAQSRRFDLAIQLHGCGLISNPLCALLGARHTAGFYLRGQFCPDPERFLIYPWHLPEVRRPLLLLGALDIPAQGEDLEFPLQSRDLELRRQVKQAYGLQTLEYACLQPATSSADGVWPLERFAALADELKEREVPVVLIGRRAEPELTRQVASAMRTACVDLGDQLPFGGAAALISHARCMISCGGALSRAAEALGVPQFVLQKETSDRNELADSITRRVITWAGLATPERIVQVLLRFGPQVGPRADTPQPAQEKAEKVLQPS